MELHEGHRWEARYSHIRSGSGCPACVDMVNGARVSLIQRRLCDQLGGTLNHPVGPLRVDIAIWRGSRAIAIEYDSWYWRGDRKDENEDRDYRLLAEGGACYISDRTT